MDWLILDSINAQEYYQNEPAVRELLASEIEYSEGSTSHRIIDIEIVTYDDAPGEAEVYLAIEHIKAGEKTIEARACAFSNEVAQRATNTKTTGFAWKDIHEGAGPIMANCPPRILDQLTSTDHPETLAWRIRCREEYAANLGATLITAETEPASIELEEGETIQDFIDDIKSELADEHKKLRAARLQLEKLGGNPLSISDLIDQQINAGKFVRISALATANKVHVLFQGVGPEGKLIIIGRFMKAETYDAFPINQVTTLDMYETSGPLEVAPDSYPDGSTTKRKPSSPIEDTN